MTSDELHKAAVIAKAEMVIEMLWSHLYDTEMAYHHDNGEQGYMGGMIRQVLDQMDGLLNDMVDKQKVLDEPSENGPSFRDVFDALEKMCNVFKGVAHEDH